MKKPERFNIYMDAPMKEAVQRLAAKLTRQTGIEHTSPDAVRWAIAQATAKKGRA